MTAPHPTRFKLVVEYDGAPYLGWQKQREGPSVEEELESALEAASGVRPPLTVAGRTDAGVHALAQVVSFDLDTKIEPRRLSHALNFHLPETITVHSSAAVDIDFSARLDSIAKRYRYRIYNGPHLPALDRGRVWHHRKILDLHAIRHARDVLIGEHDFESFRSVHCEAEHAVREIFDIELESTPRAPCGTYIDMTFHANAFCRHMCRILAGTLAGVGLGKIPADRIGAILEARDRRHAGVTAPPGGLTLLEVIYPE